MIKCNNCYKLYENDEDLLFIEKGEDSFRACHKCKTDEFLMDMETSKAKIEKKPNGGGTTITKRQAYNNLKDGVAIMCFEYGADNCEEDHSETNGECTCWTGMEIEDVEDMTFKEFEKMGWENFEIW
jgi:hypothetical protein